MSKIEREKQTVCKMIELYCRHHLKQNRMPDEYQHLAEFACRRLDHCKYGEQKTACNPAIITIATIMKRNLCTTFRRLANEVDSIIG